MKVSKYINTTIILDYLEDKGGCAHVEELQEGGEYLSRPTVFRTINRLMAQGVLEKKERGLYCISEKRKLNEVRKEAFINMMIDVLDIKEGSEAFNELRSIPIEAVLAYDDVRRNDLRKYINEVREVAGHLPATFLSYSSVRFHPYLILGFYAAEKVIRGFIKSVELTETLYYGKPLKEIKASETLRKLFFSKNTPILTPHEKLSKYEIYDVLVGTRYEEITDVALDVILTYVLRAKKETNGKIDSERLSDLILEGNYTEERPLSKKEANILKNILEALKK